MHECAGLLDYRY